MATTNHTAAERRILRRRRRLRQMLGAVVCLLVIIGLGSMISGGVQLTGRLFDNTDEKRLFEERLRNLVALDPVPFASLGEADNSTLLNALVWTCVGTVDKNTMEHDETGAMYLPTVDLNKTAAALFGPDFQPVYDTFVSRDLTYTYVPEREAYLVPITSAVTDYYPRAEKIQRRGDTKRVTIGYLSMYNDVDSFNPNAPLVPVKYNDFIFTKNKTDGIYYLSAIVASDKTASATQTPSDSLALAPEDALQEALPGDVNAASSASAASGAQSATDASSDSASATTSDSASATTSGAA